MFLKKAFGFELNQYQVVPFAEFIILRGFEYHIPLHIF